MSNAFPLTDAQLDQLRTLTTNGTQDFYRGYDYIHSQIKNEPLDSGLIFWFGRAAGVNNPESTDPARRFINDVTNFGRAYSGLPPTNTQDVLNRIGENVIRDILDKGSVPKRVSATPFNLSSARKHEGYIGYDATDRLRQLQAPDPRCTVEPWNVRHCHREQ